MSWLRSRFSPSIARLSTVALAMAYPAGASANGCPCPKQSTEESVARASLIIVGKVVATTTSGGPQMTMANGQWREAPGGATVHQITMQVDLSLKGRTGKVTSLSMPDACGYPFAVGGEYLVLATRNDTGIWTDACKGNASGAAIAPRAAEIRRVLAVPAAK